MNVFNTKWLAQAKALESALNDYVCTVCCVVIYYPPDSKSTRTASLLFEPKLIVCQTTNMSGVMKY